MRRQQADDVVDVDPDFGITLLLALVEHQLHAKVQMDGFDVVDVFLMGVARSAHEADDVAGADMLALGKTRRIGIVLSQVGIVIIAQTVVRSDSDTPAAVLVPTQRFHGAAFHGDDGRAQRAEQIVAQMPPGKPVGAAAAEIVVVRVAVAGGNGGEGLQAVGRDPFLFSGFPVGDLNGVVAYQPAQCGMVGFLIIGKVFELLSQKFRGGAVALQLLRGAVDCLYADVFSAAASCGQRQNINPRKGRFFPLRSDVDLQRPLQGRVADVKIHPADEILLCGNFRKKQ